MTSSGRTINPAITVIELSRDLVSPAATLLAQYLWSQSRTTDHQAACEASLLRLLQWPSADLFLAVQTQVLVGFVSINWGFSTSKGQPILRIQDLFTHPQHRRRGVAHALLQHLVQLGRQHGANRLQLETGTYNTPTRTLYTPLGFEWFVDKEIYMLFL